MSVSKKADEEGGRKTEERRKKSRKDNRRRAESIFAQVILSDKTGVSTISRAVT